MCLRQGGPVLDRHGLPHQQSDAGCGAAAGLTAAACEVGLGLCPYPGGSPAASAAGSGGGLMVSASHNPPETTHSSCSAPPAPNQQRGCRQPSKSGLPRWSLGPPPTNDGGRWGYRCARPTNCTDLWRISTALLESVAGAVCQGAIRSRSCWGSVHRLLAIEVVPGLGAGLQVLHGEPDGRRINVGCAHHLEP